MIEQQQDIALAFAQRRHIYRDDIEAIIEIGAELAVGDRLVEVAVGCSDDPHIDFERSLIADAVDHAFLQHP